jgi:Aspartyl protease
MRRLLVPLCACFPVAVTCTLLVGQEPKSSGSALPAGDALYQVTSAAQTACLVESRTGKTWVLDRNAGGVLGWFPLPKFGEREPRGEERALSGLPLTRESLGTASRSPASNPHGDEYTRVKLAKYASGYLGIRGTIDGQPVNLLIDTGSPATFLDRKRTAQLGFKWKNLDDRGVPRLDPGKADEGDVCDVASIGLGSYQTGRVSVGHTDLGEINAVIPHHGDFALFDGILGANVLNDCLAIIDFKTHDLYLMQRDAR